VLPRRDAHKTSRFAPGSCLAIVVTEMKVQEMQKFSLALCAYEPIVENTFQNIKNFRNKFAIQTVYVPDKFSKEKTFLYPI
jgi:hypothetical protein